MGQSNADRAAKARPATPQSVTVAGGGLRRVPPASSNSLFTCLKKFG
jgi:hypothetical protein